VDVYDAVTFVLRQSLCAPEAVTKIQGPPDGSTLFFAHPYSVTMWDVQTGGLTHTFTTRSKITDIAVPTTGDHIACGSSDGSIALWNIHTKEEGKGFGNGQPVVTVHWSMPRELVVATQKTVYIRDIATGETLNSFSIFGRLWGMVYSPLGGGEFLVGTSQPDKEGDQELCSLEVVRRIGRLFWKYLRKEAVLERQPRVHIGPLQRPAFAGKAIVCITPPSGVQSFI
jgi:WD40 repeat protein